jgi:hypothetical protein
MNTATRTTFCSATRDDCSTIAHQQAAERGRHSIDDGSRSSLIRKNSYV